MTGGEQIGVPCGETLLYIPNQQTAQKAIDIHRSTLYNIHMKNKHIITVRVSDVLREYLRAVSERDDRSMSYVIRRLLREDMDGTQGSESVRREVSE